MAASWIVATDVLYDEPTRTGRGAAVAFERWEDAAPSHEWRTHIDAIADYVPGSFYQRELPCLLALLDPLREQIGTVIVDGHVWLGEGRPGLGHHLYEALERRVAVVGVAKSRFHGGYATEVLRGTESTRPLYVTAVGLTVEAAAAYVRSMHGPYRLPTLLKRVDSLTRGLV
ncbi:MAG: endonuclease V [Myxococcota bacterium]